MLGGMPPRGSRLACPHGASAVTAACRASRFCRWLQDPALFTGYERCLADETLRNHWPDAWEAVHGRSLQPGESRARDRQIFERQHAADWIAISAVTSDRLPGFVETTATPGGQRGPGVDRRRFLVPSVEYEPGLFGFVVDPTRHRTPDEDDRGD